MDMVTLEQIVSVISNVGFPIACVIAMFCLTWRERDAHTEESKMYAEAIANNTAALEGVKTAIEHLSK